MKEEVITLDELARMVKEGFDDVKKTLRLEFKSDLTSEITSLRIEMNTRFDKVETRLDRIENIVLLDHTNRIGRLEDKLSHI